MLQTNGIAAGAPNSFSFDDIEVELINNAIFNIVESDLSEILQFGTYRNECLVLWCGSAVLMREAQILNLLGKSELIPFISLVSKSIL